MRRPEEAGPSEMFRVSSSYLIFVHSSNHNNSHSNGGTQIPQARRLRGVHEGDSIAPKRWAGRRGIAFACLASSNIKRKRICKPGVLWQKEEEEAGTRGRSQHDTEVGGRWLSAWDQNKSLVSFLFHPSLLTTSLTSPPHTVPLPWWCQNQHQSSKKV